MPLQPLQPLPMASEFGELASRAASAERLVNLYAEKMPANSRAPFILKPSPGIANFAPIGVGPIYALASIPGYLYIVSGDHFFRMVPDGTVTDLGFVGLNPNSSIAIGADQVVVVVPPRAFIANHNGLLNEITTGSGNFPSTGASSVAWIDGYFVFTSLDGTYFFVSSLLDGQTYDSLDYAKSERRPDRVQRAIAHNGELWLWGQSASAVWYNAGAADFPFRERAGSIIDHGLGAMRSLAALDGSLFWVGSDRIVYRTEGYQARRVSTHAVEEVLGRYGDLADIVCCAFLFEGHAFYAVTLPREAGLLGRTFVYDCVTSLWHERSSYSDGTGRWRINCAAQFGSRLIVGDGGNGVLYDVRADISADAGIPLSRQATLPTIVTHGPRAFMPRLEVEMEVGTAPAPPFITLEWSDDGGVTWSAPRSLQAARYLGLTRSRVVGTRLGSFRQRALRFTVAGPCTLYGVDADIQPGAA